MYLVLLRFRTSMKKYILIFGAVIVLGLIAWFLFFPVPEETPPPVVDFRDESDSAAQVDLPDVSPTSGTNPFEDSYTNPFE